MESCNDCKIFSIIECHAGKYRLPDTGLSKAQVARLIAEENTRRLIRLGNGMIK